jgi:hypothetical protein
MVASSIGAPDPEGRISSFHLVLSSPPVLAVSILFCVGSDVDWGTSGASWTSNRVKLFDMSLFWKDEDFTLKEIALSSKSRLVGPTVRPKPHVVPWGPIGTSMHLLTRFQRPRMWIDLKPTT